MDSSGFVVTYLVPAAIALLFVLALLRFFASRGGQPRPSVRSLDDKADKIGAAARQEEAEKIKGIFEDFRHKENSL